MNKGKVALTKDIISRIRSEGADYFVFVDEERAVNRVMDGASGFHFCVDDNIMTSCLSGAGSKMLTGFIPPYCATVVERLEAGGNIMLGKTGVPEFGIGISQGTAYSGPKAIAAGFCRICLSSESFGQMGKAASDAGVYFIKPAYGTVSRFGLVAYASSMEQIGVVADSVEMAFEGLRFIAGYDYRDGATHPIEKYEYEDRGDEIEGVKIAILEDFGSIEKSVLDRYLKDGATCEPVSFPLHNVVDSVAYVIGSAEGSHNLSRFDGVRFGFRSSDYKGVDDLYVNTRTEGFEMETKINILMGAFVLTGENYDRYFVKAMKLRRRIKDQISSMLESYDCILIPSGTPLANLTGEPALSMPGGLQLITKTFNESILFSLGKRFNKGGEHR
ncbi:MAG: amidase [Anaerovoracaceae bacterium]|jgi:aspartyl-tRNA(Asn)/glutamyl-tRNA(Gln) amidotransferase subunit A